MGQFLCLRVIEINRDIDFKCSPEPSTSHNSPWRQRQQHLSPYSGETYGQRTTSFRFLKNYREAVSFFRETSDLAPVSFCHPLDAGDSSKPMSDSQIQLHNRMSSW